MKRLACILVVLAFAASCRMAPASLQPSRGAESSLFVYLLPLPQDAERLRFRVESVSALGPGGVEVPLAVSLTRAGARELRRERLLARGPLAPGPYDGLLLRVGEAALRREEGDVELGLPRQEIRIDLPFTIERRAARVLSVQLSFRDSIAAGYRFEPEFSARPAARPPSGLIGLASSCRDGSVTVFDKMSGSVAAVIPAGRSPAGLAVDPARLRAYVALSDEDAVEVIDLQQLRAIDRLQLFGGDRPVELALTPDRRTLLVVNEGSDSVSVIDTIALTETTRVRVGEEPASVLVDPNGRQAYVFNTLADSVSLVDIPSGAVAATIGTDAGPLRGQLNRRGDRLYVIHRSSPYLIVLDTLSLEVIQRVYVGSGASALKVDPRTDRIYLARETALEIDIYDPFSLLPVDSIPVPGEVGYMTIDDEGNNLGVVLPGLGEIRILRLVAKEALAAIDVGEEPCWVTFLGER